MILNLTIKEVIDEWQEWAKNVIKIKHNRNNLNLDFIAGNALALIGVRRAGKTFYALDIASKKFSIENILYMNFEDPYFISNNSVNELDKLIETCTEYSFNIPKLLILDEIQNIDSWEKWVRKNIDLKKYKIIVTGSSAKLLSSEIASSLTGRSISHHIWTLSFNEFLKFKGVNDKLTKNEYLAYFKMYMLEGAFPETTQLTKKTAKQTQLKQYFEDIIHKDIIKRYEIRNTKNLYLIANYYLTNLSSLHSTHSVKKALNINAETVGEYTNHMEDAFLVFSISRYHTNLKIQSRDPKKIYVIDTGLRNVIARSISEDLGKLAENIVFIELKRQNKEIYYYKDEQEVDFIITDNFKPKEAIQVSYSDLNDSSTYKREINALLSCLKNLNLKEGLILTKNREEFIKLDNKIIRMIPLYLWMMKKTALGKN